LLLLLPLALAAWRVYRRTARQGLLFSATGRIPVRHTWRTRLQPLVPLLTLAGAAACIVALARPRTVFSRTIQRADAIAIQMAVDCSGSMQALDFSTRDQMRNRLDVVKETFARFIGARGGDLIGLVTFGGYASSRVPLTLDHDALLHTLRGVELPKDVLGPDGQILNQEEFMTAIGDGLATACARLESADVKSRIVVLLSDGESNTGLIQPHEAARAAKALGIRVYAIGVGTTGLAPVPVRDSFGRTLIRQAEVRLDEAQLKSIAATTGGLYFNVKDPKGLERALADIDRLERTPVQSELFNRYDEHYLRFLVPGLALTLAGVTLSALLRRVVV
jgi:Ca-activated chloride channel family protein